MGQFVFDLLFIFTNVYVTFASTGGKWDYLSKAYGPKTWGHNFHLCAGEKGSPININKSSLQPYNEKICSPNLKWKFKNHDTFLVENNGHNINLTPIRRAASGTISISRRRLHTDQNMKGHYEIVNLQTDNIGSFFNQFNPYKNVNEKFCFHSLHFHWGGKESNLGSEHTLNGKRFALEMHFVHYSCDYYNMRDTLKAIQHRNLLDKYVLGVIGVFVEIGKANKAFDSIIEQFYQLKYPRTVPNNTGKNIMTYFNISRLLPNNINDFYAYTGSLTTPPCSPNVRWHILKNTVTMSSYQLIAFQELMSTKNASLSSNFRPIQKNVNPVFQCFETQKKENRVVITIVIWILVGVFVLFATVYGFSHGCKKN